MSNLLDENLQSFLHYQKALAFVEDNMLTPALEEINKAIALENRPSYSLAKAKILARSGNFQEALELLNNLPDSCTEKAEAALVINRIRKLQKPFGRFLNTMRTSKLVRNILFLVVASVLLISAVLYFNMKQEARFNQNLDELQEQTRDISLQIKQLSTHLESMDLVERNDLYLQKNLILDSVRLQIIQLEKQVERVNIGFIGTSGVINNRLDSLQENMKQLLENQQENLNNPRP